MPTVEQSGCLQIVRNIELSLEHVGAMLAMCDGGLNTELLLKQKCFLEDALKEVKIRIRQLFMVEWSGASSSPPRCLTLVAGTDVAGGEPAPLR